MLAYDDVLKENYELYQRLLKTMKERSFSGALAEKESPLLSNYMKTSLKTLRKHAPYIKNSFTYSYNNGCIEGINNKI